MATPTANYGFIKDAPSQNYDVAVVNANLDAIDTQIKLRQQEAALGISLVQSANGRYYDSFPNHPGAVSSSGEDNTGLGIPRCRITKTSQQPCDHNVPEKFDMASAATTFDTDNMADRGNDRININHTGLYICTLRIAWEGDPDGTRMTIIRKNGTSIIADDFRAATPSSNTIITLTSAPVKLTATDFVEGYVSQSSGNQISFDTYNTIYPYLEVCWYAS